MNLEFKDSFIIQLFSIKDFNLIVFLERLKSLLK